MTGLSGRLARMTILTLTLVAMLALGHAAIPHEWVHDQLNAAVAHAQSTTLTASPSSATIGATVTAAWAGIPSPTSNDWIARYAVGADDTAYLSWTYVSCTQAPGAPRGSGSCPFSMPGPAGQYEFRLFGLGGSGPYGRLATSGPVAVGAASTATPTPTPTPVAMPTATPTPAPVLYEGVPLCTDHSVTVWHPLVKMNGTTITCTYGHEHHADPNAVNDIFGPPSAWYGPTQAISYPWQTSGALGLENVAKHEGYKWYVERDKECRPVGGQPGCLRAWRVQVHSMGHASDAVARYHSYSFEGLIEYQGQQGIVRHGGHIDFGHLSLAAGGGQVCPALASNPETFTCGANHHRETGAKNVPPPYTDADRGGAGWYGNHLVTGLTTTIEDWGPIDYTNPSLQLFYPADRRMNNSKGNLGSMAISFGWVRSWSLGTAPFSFDGYTDQHGNAAPACTAPGPTPNSSVVCSRLVIEHVSNVVTYWNHSAQGSMQIYDYDVVSPVTGKSLIRFPN